MFFHRQAILLLLVWLTLAACGPELNTPAPTTLEVVSILTEATTPTINLIDTASPTLTTTNAPSPTASPTENLTSPTIPGPTPTLSPLFLNNFLFGGETADCRLPCWNGLRIGKTTHEDTQVILDQTFGFNGTVDFFSESYLESFFVSSEVESSELYTTGYHWGGSDTEGYWFYLAIWFDSQANLMRGIDFIALPLEEFQIFTVYDILHELGTPLQIFAPDIRRGMAQRVGETIMSGLVLVYEEGLTFHLSSLPTLVKSEGEGTNRRVFGELCLNTNPERALSTKVYITESFQTDLTVTSPLQERALGWIEREKLPPLDTVFKASVPELMQAIEQNPNTCIYTDPGK